MGTLLFVLHSRTLAPLPDLYLDPRVVVTDKVVSLAHVLWLSLSLHLDRLAPESPPGGHSLSFSLLNFADNLAVVLAQYAFLLNVSDFADAVIWHLGVPVFLLFNLSLRRVDLFVFSLDELHELLYVLERVCLCFFVLLAAGTVHVAVVLTHQVLDDSLELRAEVSLGTIEFKWLHVAGELVKLHLFHVFAGWLLGCLSAPSLQSYELLLVLPELVLEDGVDDLKLRDLVEVIVLEMLQVLSWHVDLEQTRVNGLLSELAVAVGLKDLLQSVFLDVGGLVVRSCFYWGSSLGLSFHVCASTSFYCFSLVCFTHGKNAWFSRLLAGLIATFEDGDSVGSCL